MSESALEWLRNFALSAWTAGSAISAIICSYLLSIDASLSNIFIPGGLRPPDPPTPSLAGAPGPAPFPPPLKLRRTRRSLGEGGRVAHSLRSFALRWFVTRRLVRAATV